MTAKNRDFQRVRNATNDVLAVSDQLVKMLDQPGIGAEAILAIGVSIYCRQLLASVNMLEERIIGFVSWRDSMSESSD